MAFMCYSTLDTDGEKTEPTTCQRQDIPRTFACITTGKRLFFSLYRAVWRYLKNALQKSNFEPCPLFNARECNLDSNQGNSHKSLQGSTPNPKYVESSFFSISSARLLNVMRTQQTCNKKI